MKKFEANGVVREIPLDLDLVNENGEMIELIIEKIIYLLTGLAFFGILFFACGIEDAYGNRQIECVIGLFICLAWIGIIAFLGNLEAKREKRRRKRR